MKDGPFTEAKELVAGFWIIQVKSLDEAIEWAKRIPGSPTARRSKSAASPRSRDFEDVMSPETIAQEEAMRDASPRKPN